MSRVEERLQNAAAETRQVTRHNVPPGIDHSPRRARTGWLVFAAAFIAVVVLVGAIPLLTGPGEGQPVATDPVPEPTEPISEPTDPVTEPGPVGDCSAAGMEMPASLPELPGPVAETRNAVAAAAIACDYEALARLGGPDLTTSFGGGGVDNLERWEAEGEEPLATMIKVLDMSHGVRETEDAGAIHVWPSAHAYPSWEETPQEAISELLTLYTEADLDRFDEFGGYAGWRLGISEDGQWLFFVAGD